MKRRQGTEPSVVASRPLQWRRSEGTASSGGHGRSTGRPGGISHDLQIVRHSQDADLGSLVACESQSGAAGIDAETIERFETKLAANLYKLWNRMSSGSYFPPPVKAVPIPKKSGGVRVLGVPTSCA